MQILVPIAGSSPFFRPEDYQFPKPLIEVCGKPMIQRVVENLASATDEPKFIFVARRGDVARFSLSSTLDLLAEGCKVVSLRNPCHGAMCSCLMAVDEIDEDAPMIIANGDQVIENNIRSAIEYFEAMCADAGVIVFDSIHPRWSYVKREADGRVLQAAEKQVISRDAVAGFYYFRKAAYFIETAKKCIIANASVDGQFYISASLNEMILDGRNVQSFAIEGDHYHSFYSPAKIQEFEERANKLRAKALIQSGSVGPIRVVIPAAGEGSRFRAAGYDKPKPFIDVRGKPMIAHVIENVRPRTGEVHVLLRRDHITAAPAMASDLRSRGFGVHEVERLTEGTACTLLLERQLFDDDVPLLIANADQLVDFSVDDYVNDCIERRLDGSILVFHDSFRDPKWSFARIGKDGFVREVAEKKPISDLATVGIYLFHRGSAFVDAAIDMIVRNDRVNNEFYTCPVYNYMIKHGARIGVYEIGEKCMHGLGTPGDLESYLADRCHA